ncbi:hypothetical protein H2199_000391 [Coniosporium tulheliwenetii]|uniref:Uncharacterized protein n=1 Tax=Coniosporium tulheliwenetii TaxID=3383036 RepID=A0ACC2ZQ34_9PEZI|nr:hypothetical protein H2199_000391 [Cladosporium sp. JES 115]
MPGPSEAPLSLISTQMMAAQQRPSSRRAASATWDRLKSRPSDALEQYGLPSKGETRLNDFKAQENYYNKIVERYMKFCASCGGGDGLEKAFASLSLSSSSTPTPSSNPAPSQSKKSGAPSLGPRKTSSAQQTSPPTPQADLPAILSAMRKLREALVASHRLDVFAQRAYTFIIHASILCRHFESYHPALLYLLHVIHPVVPLSEPELHEFVGYHVLDLACRQADLGAAYAVKVAYGHRDPAGRVEVVLKSLVHDDYVGFWRVRRAVDGYQKAVIEWAEEGMRLHALKCLGRSYMNADRQFVEKMAEASWKELVEKGVGWELVGEGEKVIIRRPKPK